MDVYIITYVYSVYIIELMIYKIDTTTIDYVVAITTNYVDHDGDRYIMIPCATLLYIILHTAR